MSTAITAATTVTLRCRAFTGGTIARRPLLVDADGTVSVYDTVAGHWTTCHALSPTTCRRARRIAAEMRDA
jgi:hypothetical protein